ncbi:MAG: hypothetical protein GY804_08990 [Alphaproteobacteria bacterium]|nr:hypothetical protein [Alphaproteobacteria bacterium]
MADHNKVLLRNSHVRSFANTLDEVTASADEIAGVKMVSDLVAEVKAALDELNDDEEPIPINNFMVSAITLNNTSIEQHEANYPDVDEEINTLKNNSVDAFTQSTTIQNDTNYIDVKSNDLSIIPAMETTINENDLVIKELTIVVEGDPNYFYPIWFNSNTNIPVSFTIFNELDLFAKYEVMGGDDPEQCLRFLKQLELTQNNDYPKLVLPSVNIYSATIDDLDHPGYICTYRHGFYLRGAEEYTFQTKSDIVYNSVSICNIKGTESEHLLNFSPDSFVVKSISEMELSTISADPELDLGEYK